MTALAWIAGLLLIAGFGVGGVAKITEQLMLTESADHLGFSHQQYRMIGVAEVAGAAGVLIGLLGQTWLASSRQVVWRNAVTVRCCSIVGLAIRPRISCRR